MKALVTGGTGFVGPRLLRLLNKPTVLTRNPERAAEKIGHLAGSVIGWNPIEGPPPPDSFDGVDCVFHLAGESVAEGRWTTSQKAKIRD
ncbi:MAG: NAD-dependent epimerase/dehydratase family protein, partial [Pirellulales bacterium]